MDDGDNSSYDTTNQSKEIQDIQKEVISLNMDECKADESSNELDSIDDLKASIMSHDV